MRVVKRSASRFLSLVIPWAFALGLAQAASAQQSVPLSPSVVLVLKLVSSTHVKPTTGIVVSDNGLVLVPAEFASGEGEMIVLDGGTDILSNGRPAKLVAQAVPGELAMLSVEGLKRPGITLSGETLDADSVLYLEAFPPAEYIAKGAQPLRVPVKVLHGEDDSPVSISPATPLPYVSGAIIDNCGYLAGVSLTSGPQSLATREAAQLLFGDQLGHILDVMQITLPAASCGRPVQASATPAVTTVHKDRAAESPATPQLTAESEETGPVELATGQPPVNETIADSFQGNVFDPGQQTAASTPEPPSVWRSMPLWLPLLGIIVLGVFIWKGWFFFRRSRHAPGQTRTTEYATPVQPASDEPVTAPLETSADSSVLKPRSAPVLDFDIPGSSTRPEGCDGVLVVEGLIDADTGFKRFCFVNTEQVNIVIGRGGADIAIEHAAISRAHLRVESDGATMTLSDLGSRNGTFIGDTPCLPGEVLHFEENDDIFLGDVKLTVRVVRQEAAWA